MGNEQEKSLQRTPVPRIIGTTQGIVMALGPAQKAEIIDLIYVHRGIPGAAEKADLSLREVMETMDDDEDFAAKVERALNHLTAIGEQELMRRAIDGVESVVTSQGKVVNVMDELGFSTPLVERKYSDSLLSQFLKARKKAVFGDKVEVEHTHKGHIAVPVISQEALMLALESGSPLDFTPQDVIDGSAVVKNAVGGFSLEQETEPDFDII